MTVCGRGIAWRPVVSSVMFHLALAWELTHCFPLVKPDVSSEAAPLTIRLFPPASKTNQDASRTTNLGREMRERRREDARPVSEAGRPVLEAKGEAPSQVPALTTPDVGAMIDAAKRNIGSIDRELRQALPSRGTTFSSPSSLEKGISAAGASRGIVTQELMLGDGRRVTKVITSSGIYCIFGRKPGAGIAENELAAMTTTTCPN